MIEYIHPVMKKSPFKLKNSPFYRNGFHDPQKKEIILKGYFIGGLDFFLKRTTYSQRGQIRELLLIQRRRLSSRRGPVFKQSYGNRDA